MPVDVPPLAVQNLIEVGGGKAVDAQPPGQGGVDVGVGVDEPGHDDAAPGVHQLRLRVLLPQLGGGAHGGNALSVDGYAAVLQVMSLPFARMYIAFSSSFSCGGNKKCFKPFSFETPKQS